MHFSPRKAYETKTIPVQNTGIVFVFVICIRIRTLQTPKIVLESPNAVRDALYFMSISRGVELIIAASASQCGYMERLWRLMQVLAWPAWPTQDMTSQVEVTTRTTQLPHQLTQHNQTCSSLPWAPLSEQPSMDGMRSRRGAHSRDFRWHSCACGQPRWSGTFLSPHTVTVAADIGRSSDTPAPGWPSLCFADCGGRAGVKPNQAASVGDRPPADACPERQHQEILC